MKDTLAFQPLYKQVYDRLVIRISEGYWKPAEALPSEYALANELGVSQGTVRKALNELEAEKLVEGYSTRNSEAIKLSMPEHTKRRKEHTSQPEATCF